MDTHIVVLTGAGMSAESGLSTFRDSGGLWEQNRIEDVATPDAFARDPGRVLDFYNRRRQQLRHAAPNGAHRALADLERTHRVTVITQNVDDLHERAGSSRVVHLHGELVRARSSARESLVYDIGYDDIELGDQCELGSQLRPHVVWFGEAVPMIEVATNLIQTATHVLIVGTSLQVYPAAGLVDWVADTVPVTVIDPAETLGVRRARVMRATASEGVPAWIAELQSALD